MIFLEQIGYYLHGASVAVLVGVECFTLVETLTLLETRTKEGLLLGPNLFTSDDFPPRNHCWGLIYSTCEFLDKLYSFKGSRCDFLRSISGRVHISTRVNCRSSRGSSDFSAISLQNFTKLTGFNLDKCPNLSVKGHQNRTSLWLFFEHPRLLLTPTTTATQSDNLLQLVRF